MARREALLKLHKRLVARRNELRKVLADELSDLRSMDRVHPGGDAADAAFDTGSDEISSQLAELEARELAQVERALAWGIDVTHLAPHLSAITLRPEFFDVYLELAVEQKLPIRLPSTITADQAGFPFRRLAEEEGVVFPDHFDHDWRAGSRSRVFDAFSNLQPGVTEIHVQPVIDSPEVRALTTDAAAFVDDYLLMTNDTELPAAIAASGAVLIGYRQLRDVMRAG